MTIVLWIVTGILIALSFYKKKTETLKALKKAKAMMKSMLVQILMILLILGLILGIIPPEIIQELLGQNQSIISVVLASFLGSITIIPGFVAFPLVGSLVNQGAGYAVAAAFLTTLTMVGVATMSIEIKQFGIKFTAYRNMISFIAAVMIAMVLGVVM